MPRRRDWSYKHFDFKSKLEQDVGKDLLRRKVKFYYELEAYGYTVSVDRSRCPSCGEGPAIIDRSYTPDFWLPNGIIVECKGRFTAEERKKHVCMKEQHPDKDIRILFQSNNWMTKKRKQRYGDWCDKKGIIWAVGRSVPEEWLNE